MKLSPVLYISYCLLFFGLLVLSFWASLFTWSSFPISAMDAIGGILSLNDQSIPEQIVRDIRLPRALLAATVGACFAAAGVVMQGLTQNPLASPAVLGVNAGAALGMAAVSTITPWFGLLGISMAAMIGGGV
ncbi:MAG: iron chelate uptake ABC transporter family permease subunit, partial [Marinomonas sp.]